MNFCMELAIPSENWEEFMHAVLSAGYFTETYLHYDCRRRRSSIVKGREIVYQYACFFCDYREDLDTVFGLMPDGAAYKLNWRKAESK